VASLCAPTKSDLQQTGIVMVRGPLLRADIAALLPALTRLRTAPLPFAIVAQDSEVVIIEHGPGGVKRLRAMS
jgi:hypothetical protein